MPTLDELAIKYNTDKSSLGHNYCPFYEKHLPEKVTNFLEIGVWKGASIKMFKEWYKNEGKFYAMDVFGGEVISQAELLSIGIFSFPCSQSDTEFIKKIEEKFDVISEDASHHSDEQVLTFKNLFKNNLAKGGTYVLEDLCCCSNPYWWRGVVTKFEDTALAIFKKFKEGGTLECQFINGDESKELIGMIDSLEIYNDNIAFIKKK